MLLHLGLVLLALLYRLGTVGPFYFVAKAQGATNVCKTDCLMQKN